LAAGGIAGARRFRCEPASAWSDGTSLREDFAMPRPIVIAYHLIWTGYGWWPPNDLRGSMSRTIASDVIAELGELHYGRRKVQPSGRAVEEFHRQSAEVLKHPLLEFGKPEVAAIGEAVGEAVAEQRYTCYACALMPDHVHSVIRKHKHQAEQMIEILQEDSRSRLRDCRLRPFDHPVWGGPGWVVFLDRPEAVRRTTRYVEDNPVKGKLPRQRWGFVREYDGWPLHPGHSPNSPYARRLRGME
jgi:REP element-mobilizing transposase RayT